MSFLKNYPLLSFGVAALAILTLSGCGDDFYVQQPDEVMNVPSPALNLSLVPPPAPTPEVKPMLTDPRTQIWRPGHWAFRDQQFVWEEGQILNRPSPTAVWSPDRWEHRKYGWGFIHGYWQ